MTRWNSDGLQGGAIIIEEHADEAKAAGQHHEPEDDKHKDHSPDQNLAQDTQ